MGLDNFEYDFISLYYPWALCKPMMADCELDPREQTYLKFE